MIAGDHDLDTETRTLSDLLSELQRSHRQFGAQGAAAAEISRFFEKPIDAIPIQMLHGIDIQFRTFLLGRGWKIKSARTYVAHLRRLVSEAVLLGWTQPIPEWPAEWALVLSAIERTKGITWIVKDAVENESALNSYQTTT